MDCTACVMSSNYRSILNVQGSSFASTNSFTFDGNSDCVTMGVPSDLRFNRLDTFSFSAWVNVSPTDSNTILSNQLAPSTNYRGYYFSVQSNQLICIFRSTLSDRLIFNGSTNLSSGWNHVVFTYDGTASTSSGQFYINGSADTTTGTGTLTATAESTDTLYLGCRSNADNFLLGNIDEVSVFNSELSGGFAGSDITTIYNNGVPNDISSFNPISWWRMGEAANYSGGEWVLTDQGSASNNGTSTTIPAPPTEPSTDVPS